MMGEGVVAYAGDVGGRVAIDYSELFRYVVIFVALKRKCFLLCCSQKVANSNYIVNSRMNGEKKRGDGLEWVVAQTARSGS